MEEQPYISSIGFSVKDSFKGVLEGKAIARDKLIHMLQNGLIDELSNIKKTDEHSPYLDKVKTDCFKFFSAESKKGNLYATSFVGYFHAEGWGTKKSEKKALEVYQIASNANNPFAYYFLGIFYRSNSPTDKKFKQDYAKAIENFTKGANLGDCGCLCRLGLMHCEGQGVVKDIVKGNNYHKQAAQAGDRKSLFYLTTTVEAEYNNKKEWLNPFQYYYPKYKNFKSEIVYDKQVHVQGSGSQFVSVQSNNYNVSATLNISYSDNEGIKGVSFSKKVPWFSFGNFSLTAHGYTVGNKTILDRSRATSVYFLFHIKLFSDFIIDSDRLYEEHIEQQKALKAAQPAVAYPSVHPQNIPSAQSFPGAFFPTQPSGMAPIPPMDQQQMLQMMQMVQLMQQNPQLAAQMASMGQQFQGMNLQQPQPPQQPPHQNDNNQQLRK